MQGIFSELHPTKVGFVSSGLTGAQCDSDHCSSPALQAQPSGFMFKVVRHLIPDCFVPNLNF